MLWDPRYEDERLEIRTKPYEVSFEAFLELAAVSLYDCERDRHWKSIQTYCTVCNLEYDFILKQETAMAENDFLIEVMGYGDTKPLLHIPGKYKTDRNQVYWYFNINPAAPGTDKLATEAFFNPFSSSPLSKPMPIDLRFKKRK